MQMQQYPAGPQYAVATAPQMVMPPQAPVPQMMMAMPQNVCDRTSTQKGATRLQNPNMIQIRYNAQIRDVGCAFKMLGMGGCLFCCGIWAPPCSFFDQERSYLYLREGSLETNVSMGHMCFKCPDHVSVQYFDRSPFAVKGCLCPDEPKLEVVDPALMCCCVKCDCELCFGKKFVVIMPFEKSFICCTNRTNCCHNCCNLCGPVSGNPIVFSSWLPQPANTENFVAMAKQTIPAAQRMG